MEAALSNISAPTQGKKTNDEVRTIVDEVETMAEGLGHIRTEPDAYGDAQWELNGDPTMGKLRIEENSADLEWRDLTGAHSTPYLDVDAPTAGGENWQYRATLEGSNFLQNGGTPGYDQPNGSFRGWGASQDDFDLPSGEGVGE